VVFMLASGRTLAAAMAGLAGLAILLAWAGPPRALHDDSQFVTVTLATGRKLAVARLEVTYREWKACHDGGGCAFLPPGRRSATGDFPVTGVNRFDVAQYLAWVNAETGRRYRLPTAEDWNALADGPSRRPRAKKLFDDPRLAWAADYGAMEQVPATVRSSGGFGANRRGIADLSGNVWEWTATCAAQDRDDRNCPAYLVEGLHETALSVFIRDPAAGGCAVGTPPANIGFRLVEERG
jgi:formylglycine-generating enzyme required for sulfatase activity